MSELVIRLIKILDIGYASMFYIVSAILLVSLLNKVEGEYNEENEKKRTTSSLFISVILKTWLIGTLAYITRNIFHMIPWPLEGVYGYKHLKVKEVLDSAVFVSFMVIFDKHLQSRVGILKDRLIGKTTNKVELL
jgi:hypothetical protein